MHIAHHRAASHYTKLHNCLGSSAAALAAIVGSSVFASLMAQTNVYVTVVTGGASMLAAFLIAVHTFLNCNERAGKHIAAAASFQRIRRDLEYQKAWLEDGAPGLDNHQDLLCQWQEAIKSAPPLPQHIHDAVKLSEDDRASARRS